MTETKSGDIRNGTNEETNNKYMSKNKGCSYRDIREHAMNRASIYEGACLENYIQLRSQRFGRCRTSY